MDVELFTNNRTRTIADIGIVTMRMDARPVKFDTPITSTLRHTVAP